MASYNCVPRTFFPLREQITVGATQLSGANAVAGAAIVTSETFIFDDFVSGLERGIEPITCASFSSRWSDGNVRFERTVLAVSNESDDCNIFIRYRNLTDQPVTLDVRFAYPGQCRQA